VAKAVSDWLHDAALRAERRFPRAGSAIIAPLLQVIPRVRTDRLGVEAGSITYGAFLSLPPLILLVGAGTAMLFADDPRSQRAVTRALVGLVPGLEDAIPGPSTITPGGRLGLGIVGLVGLAWAASGFAARARIALSAVFRGPPTSLIFGRSSAALVGVPVVVAIAGMTLVVGAITDLGLSGLARSVARVTLELAILAASVGVFLVVYWALTPRGQLPLRQHLPGAVSFAAAWWILSRVGHVVVGAVATRSTALYGLIGVLFGVLAFIYIAMWCFLVSAEVTQVVRERRAGQPHHAKSAGR
jgi:YihY family inner membrane protein